MTITVLNNAPPVVAAPSEGKLFFAQPDVPLTFWVIVSDEQPKTVTLQKQTTLSKVTPQNWGVDTTQHLWYVRVVPTVSEAGKVYPITFIVRDEAGQEVKRTVSVSVGLLHNGGFEEGADSSFPRRSFYGYTDIPLNTWALTHGVQRLSQSARK